MQRVIAEKFGLQCEICSMVYAVCNMKSGKAQKKEFPRRRLDFSLSHFDFGMTARRKHFAIRFSTLAIRSYASLIRTTITTRLAVEPTFAMRLVLTARTKFSVDEMSQCFFQRFPRCIQISTTQTKTCNRVMPRFAEFVWLHA